MLDPENNLNVNIVYDDDIKNVSDDDEEQFAEDIPEQITEEVSQDAELKEETLEAEQKQTPLFIPTGKDDTLNFASVEEEVAYYKDRTKEMQDYYNSDEFVKSFTTEYANILMEKEKEVEKLIAIKSALDGSPAAVYKLYFGKEINEELKLPVITDDEAKDYVSKELSKKFGKNYLDKYDTSELNDPDSLSSRIKTEYDRISEEISKHNEEIIKQKDNYKQLSQEEIDAALDEQYESDFSQWMKKEDYNEFVKEIRDQPITMLNLYKAHVFDLALKEEYNKGIKEGRKLLGEELKKTGAPQKVVSSNNKTIVNTVVKNGITKKGNIFDV